mmetsp:Transcript_29492/g.44651  ORF Transcript_29492/g.44651 Transcript_29492/m.44651 type:complete len:398 (+) Transcript_29492:308-1501(+)|eukprot:CAMPEP_0178936592 /NCGR_PEP_ID=MMETSP0786-20121207/25267_1 /TAXON_ID=186022 /ORGANISM="Thalassionema frauenfeldii, Strain CCMP 1798" /LENGTH=397 /DNA_ID=CAMNT_0020615029 /DNA_START=164 /DNA_END=1357 /DNA_ORIENTATION=+
MKFSLNTLFIASLATSAGAFSSFTPSSSLTGVQNDSALKMSLEKYSDELKETAAKMVRPGYGLLACDESTGTVGTRLESIGLENIEENRQKWRQLLFTTPDLGNHISGAILFEETLYQSSTDGKPFVDVLNEAGIIPGIKVDSGLKALCGGGDDETWCSGLDGLYEKCCKHYDQGARFAKWRTAVRINVPKGLPSSLAVKEAAWGLARYARICQEAGLVPIVEPEILIDGDHDINTTAKIQEHVITTTYKYLEENGVMLEGTLLKPSMTVAGVNCKDKPTPAEVAAMTVQTLQRSIPPAMPGVTFLSGGISEEDSSVYLNEINKIDRVGPWALTFSFSRAMQSSCLKTWNGEDDNIKAAQDQLLARARANGAASKGEYKPGSEPSLQEALYVANYVY